MSSAETSAPSASSTPSATADEWEFWYPDAYEIGSESVRSFARATRDPFIPYSERNILPADTPIPMILLASPMFDASANLVSRNIPGCNMSKIVHATQQFTVHEPLRMGLRITLACRFVSHIVKAGNDIIVIEAAAIADGKIYLSATLTIAHAPGAGADIDLDPIADQVMLTGTGPSDSDAYTAVHA